MALFVLCAEHDGMGADRLVLLVCCQEEQSGVLLVVEIEWEMAWWTWKVEEVTVCGLEVAKETVNKQEKEKKT